MEQPTRENTDPCYFNHLDFIPMVIVWIVSLCSCGVVSGLIYWVMK